jgi:hypothetical protein
MTTARPSGNTHTFDWRKIVKKSTIAVFGGVLAAGFLSIPVAHADPNDQASLGQSFADAGGLYVGQWGAHGEHLTVNADGTGSETYNGGSVNFRMNEVQFKGQPNTAYGNIVSGGHAERGSSVTMQIVDNGQGLLLTVANGDTNFPFCKIVNGGYVNSADCGA